MYLPWNAKCFIARLYREHTVYEQSEIHDHIVAAQSKRKRQNYVFITLVWLHSLCMLFRGTERNGTSAEYSARGGDLFTSSDTQYTENSILYVF